VIYSHCAMQPPFSMNIIYFNHVHHNPPFRSTMRHSAPALPAVLTPLSGLTNCVQYFLPANIFAQAAHIKRRTLCTSFRDNKKLVSFTTMNNNVFAFRLFKYICQLLPGLRVGINLHSSLHHVAVRHPAIKILSPCGMMSLKDLKEHHYTKCPALLSKKI